MLVPASLHRDALAWLWRDFVASERSLYYFMTPYHSTDFPVSNDSAFVQYVCMDGDRVVGLFSARLDYLTKTARDIDMVRLTPDKSCEWVKDIARFSIMLFEKYGMARCVVRVIEGNPAKRHYEDWVKKFGGREVGTFSNDIMTRDGQLRDVTFYEFYWNKCLDTWRKGNITLQNYREGVS